MTISPEELKLRYRRFVEEVWNQGDLAVADELIAPDMVHHDPRAEPGIEGVKRTVTEVRRAFPDLHGTIEDVIVEGSMQVGRVVCTGTHQGAFAGIEATGASVRFELVDINRWGPDGKCVEHRTVADMSPLFQQIGG